MKTDVIELSDTRKNLVVEIPTDTVEAEIDRVVRTYSRSARIAGFRPGKVPPGLVRKRFRDQILHDVAHGLIPRAIDEALRERGLEPVDTPDVRDVVVEEGQPLRFTASFETIPPIDPGDYGSIALRRPPVTVSDADVDEALARLRDRAARYEPVEDRPAAAGDTVVVDLERRPLGDDLAAAERHEDVSIDLGAPANPPGLDDELVGLGVGATKSFTIAYPEEHAVGELAGKKMGYSVSLKAIKRRVLPELDDEFAKDLGEFDSLNALAARVRDDLRVEAEAEADRRLRADLGKQLATRVSFEVPESLVRQEIDRRLEEFVRRLVDQRIDPARAGVNWEQFRDRQRESATEAVRAALVLDEVARREGIAPTEADLREQIDRYAERSGRTASAVRARLEQEEGVARLETGLRREKAIDFLLTRVKIVHA